MLQQIIRSISRAILGRVADSNEKLKNSISENASKAAAFEQQQLQTNKNLSADLESKDKRIGELQEQATTFEKNTENLVRDLESHKQQIWANVDAKDQLISDNTNGVQSLQQSIKDIWDNVIGKDTLISDNILKTKELSEAHQKLKDETKAQFDALAGVIDDKNLDSIREIADRIKADAAQAQTIRQEMQLEDSRLNSKIDILLPKDLQNKTMQEWEQIIEAIVEEEVTSLNLEP